MHLDVIDSWVGAMGGKVRHDMRSSLFTLSSWHQRLSSLLFTPLKLIYLSPSQMIPYPYPYDTISISIWYPIHIHRHAHPYCQIRSSGMIRKFSGRGWLDCNTMIRGHDKDLDYDNIEENNNGESAHGKTWAGRCRPCPRRYALRPHQTQTIPCQIIPWHTMRYHTIPC